MTVVTWTLQYKETENMIFFPEPYFVQSRRCMLHARPHRHLTKVRSRSNACLLMNIKKKKIVVIDIMIRYDLKQNITTHL